MSSDSTTLEHSYFFPLPDADAERFAAYLYRHHQRHEAVVKEFPNLDLRAWEAVDPDMQRSYRAIAIAAIQFIDRRVRKAF